jgi:putative DNA primase/helicase
MTHNERFTIAALPPEITRLRNWLVWRMLPQEGGKPRKVPYYASGPARPNQQGTAEDRALLATFEEAVAAIQRSQSWERPYTGLGFAPLDDTGIVALDFDDCVTDGVIAPHVEALCEGTYTEFSPSGRGVRAFFTGSLLSKKDVPPNMRGPWPIEVFGHNGFVTVTGNVTPACDMFGWAASAIPCTAAVYEMYRARGWDTMAQAVDTAGADALMALAPNLGLTHAQIAEHLALLPTDLDYDTWLGVGQSVHQETRGSDEGFRLWDNWSKLSPKYTTEKYGWDRWRSFGRYSGGAQRTMASVIKLANEQRARQKYLAADEWKTRIADTANEFELREKVCPQIVKDERLGEEEREKLAHALSERFRGLGTKLPIAACRKMLAPHRAAKARGEDDLPDWGDGEGESADSSDVFLSRELADLLADRFKFEHNGRGWLTYRDGAWLPCAKGEMAEEAKRLGGHLLRKRASETVDPDKAAKLTRLAMRAMSAAGLAAAEKLAQSDPRIAVAPEEFDTDRQLLNARNGVVHLVPRELRPHTPELLLSRQCAAPYIPDAGCTLWLQFLREISCNDDEWIDFVWRACGYTVAGLVAEEVMFFLLGQGANGKSVFANVLRRIMHTYATTVPASFLSVSNRDAEAATPSLATLPGARLALANEVEAGSRLSAQTVKVACSTEAISARHMYGRAFTFQPSHKLWVRGNHKPIITDNDDGIWRRIVLIPFERNFAPHERDIRLEEKLMEEAAGILAWMVRGYGEYLTRGLRPTGRIAAASAAYRRESDILGQWIDECARLGPAFDTEQGAAYSDYQGWCTSQGVRAVAKKSFTRGLEERGIRQGQRGSGKRERVYLGMRLCYPQFGAQDAQDFA